MNRKTNKRPTRLSRKSWLVSSVGIVAVGTLLLTTVGLGSTSASASSHRAVVARPHGLAVHNHSVKADTSYPVTAVTQEFTKNTKGFCPATSGNLPCDGAPGDYGTIDRVVGGF